MENPDVADNLSSEQVSAVLDLYTEDVQWLADAGISFYSTDTEPVNANVVAKGKTPVGTTEYHFEADFQWNAHGEGEGYSDLEHSSFGRSNSIAGQYVKNSRQSGEVTIYSDYFRAWEAGQFSLEFGADFRTVTAKIEIRGDELADWNVLEKTSPV